MRFVPSLLPSERARVLARRNAFVAVASRGGRSPRRHARSVPSCLSTGRQRMLLRRVGGQEFLLAKRSTKPAAFPQNNRPGTPSSAHTPSRTRAPTRSWKFRSRVNRGRPRLRHPPIEASYFRLRFGLKGAAEPSRVARAVHR